MSDHYSTTPNGSTPDSLAITLRGLSWLSEAWGAYRPQVTEAADAHVMQTVSVLLDVVATELEALPARDPKRRGRRRTGPAPDDNARWLSRRLKELGDRDHPGGRPA